MKRRVGLAYRGGGRNDLSRGPTPSLSLPLPGGGNEGRNTMFTSGYSSPWQGEVRRASAGKGVGTRTENFQSSAIGS